MTVITPQTAERIRKAWEAVIDYDHRMTCTEFFGFLKELQAEHDRYGDSYFTPGDVATLTEGWLTDVQVSDLLESAELLPW